LPKVDQGLDPTFAGYDWDDRGTLKDIDVVVTGSLTTIVGYRTVIVLVQGTSVAPGYGENVSVIHTMNADIITISVNGLRYEVDAGKACTLEFSLGQYSA